MEENRNMKEKTKYARKIEIWKRIKNFNEKEADGNDDDFSYYFGRL